MCNPVDNPNLNYYEKLEIRQSDEIPCKARCYGAFCIYRLCRRTFEYKVFSVYATKVDIYRGVTMRPNNRPQKGSTIKVEPIREPKDIRLIKKLLAERPRDLAVFTLGINTNLRASDLLPITVDQVRHLKAGEHFTIREQKTGKLRDVTMNRNVFESLQALLLTMPDAGGGEFLFQSRKGRQALCVSYLNALVKSWCREVNLKGNFGSHTLRKTFGYIHRTVFNTDIPTLMQMFNHSSQRQTLTYLGIQPSEIKEAYLREI